MKKLIGTLAVLALALSGFTFVAASPALAASRCDSSETVTATPSSGPGGTTITVTATVKDCNGNPLVGVLVTFSLKSGPCAVTFSSTTAITNAQGQATVTFVLPNSCPGNYVINALANGVNRTTTVVETGGFPATAADPVEQPVAGLSLESSLLLLAAGALMVAAAGGALFFRRRRS